MATANKTLDEWREILEKILQYYADIPYRYGDVITYRDLDKFGAKIRLYPALTKRFSLMGVLGGSNPVTARKIINLP
jgi:hypothetical protein